VPVERQIDMLHASNLDPNHRRFIAVTCLVIAVDSAAKSAVRESSFVRGLPHVVPVQNAGYVLEVGKGSAPAVISALFLAAMAGWVVRSIRRGSLRPLAGGLLIGGAASNVLERIVRGAVTDFIATPWIVFDLADLAVLTGLAMVLTARLRGARPFSAASAHPPTVHPAATPQGQIQPDPMHEGNLR
jgi:signal peptidase II